MENKSLIFCITDGVGISPSMNGNAFVSSQPKNFEQVWKHCPHFPLYPAYNDSSEIENEELDFARVFTGQKIISDKKLIDLLVDHDELVHENKINDFLTQMAERNAALHLIGNVSGDNDEYSSLDHLLALIDFARKKNVYRIYIHLIVNDSDSRENMKKDMEKYLEKIEKLNVAQILSVLGLSYVGNDALSISVHKSLHTIFHGKGKRAIDPIQAINLDSKSKNIPPFSILYNNQFTQPIRSFDSVIFFNHNNKELRRFISVVSENIVASASLPKFIKYGSFFNPFSSDSDKLTVFFKRQLSPNLIELATENNIPTISLTDNSGLQNFNYLSTKAFENVKLFDSNYDDPVVKYQILLKEIAGEVEEASSYFKFIIVYLPYLKYASFNHEFGKVMSIAKETDNFLGQLVDFIKKSGNTLVLASCTGGSEKMIGRNDFEKANRKTLSPVPFILIDGKTKNEVSKKPLYDMMKKKFSIFGIAPSILDLLGIENILPIDSKSLISNLKTYEN